MNKTRLGVRPLGRTTLAYSLALVMALIILLPGTALAQGGQPWSAPAQQSGSSGQVYYVQFGDTLSSIALRFGVTVEELMRANGLRNPNFVYVGQALTIPCSDGGGTGGPQCSAMHTVRFGETASSIARRYDVDLWDLARANAMLDLNRIYAGQVLCIPGGGWQGQPEPLPWPLDPNIPNNPENQGRPEPLPWPLDPNIPNNPENQGRPEPLPWPLDPNIPNNPENQGRGEPLPWPLDPNIPNNPENQGRGEPLPWPLDPNIPNNPENQGRGEPLPWPLDPNIQQPGRPFGPDLGYWKGSYFKDKYLSEFVEERQDAEIRFNWYGDSPGPNIPNDRFSVRWERVLEFEGGAYRFHATSDDGVRVYVDDTIVIDAWNIQPATEFQGDITLRPGMHKVVVEYFEEANEAEITVYWEPKRDMHWK